MATFRLALVMALASLLFAACGTGNEDASPPTNSGATTTESEDLSTTSPSDELIAVDGEPGSQDQPDEDGSAESDSSGSDTNGDDVGEAGESASGDSDDAAPTVTQILDEFVVSTTANPQDYKAINRAGNEIVEAWWYPTGATTYAELAESLEAKSLITEELADEWRLQGDQALVAAPEETKVIKMWPVRVADDNATYQISAIGEGEVDETLTFIEFESEDGSWKATGIE